MNLGHCDTDLLVSDFDYQLPPDLIAQAPLERRDESRLLVLDKGGDAITHSSFNLLPIWLRPGDLLVANDSRVLPARLKAYKRTSGGKVELLLLRQEQENWWALARPAKRLGVGTVLVALPNDRSDKAELEVSVIETAAGGIVLLNGFGPSPSELDDYGELPLPPYIHGGLSDVERYQTIYAKSLGSAAAPTAGLHFTDATLDVLHRSGVGWTTVTLHVGLDTFRPMMVERVADHHMHREWYSVSAEAARLIQTVKARNGRVIAVGTTAARVLETIATRLPHSCGQGVSGMTDLFIVPGYTWRVVDGLVTNFHLPRSTLFMMVCALAGKDNTFRAYDAAIRERYRFYSFGDAMLVTAQDRPS